MDVDLKDKKSLVSMEEVYKALAHCKADVRLLLVDACRDDPHAKIDRGKQDEFESVTSPHIAPPPGGVMALFATHPPIEERIAALTRQS